MVHRDLKPTNIMISEHGQVKLTDFGLAKGKLTSFHTTKSRITRGTPAYMSPEQVEGAELTPASDQFSLGSLLYEMVTGERLFDDNLADTLIRVSEVRPTGDLGRLRAMAPDLGALVERCLQLDPADRFGSTTDLYGAIRFVRIRLAEETDLAGLVEAARRSSMAHGASSDEPVLSTRDFFHGQPVEPTSGRPMVPTHQRPELPSDWEVTMDPDASGELPSGAGMSQEITFVSRRDRD
jgi:serine/threonine-protein kinase